MLEKQETDQPVHKYNNRSKQMSFLHYRRFCKFEDKNAFFVDIARSGKCPVLHGQRCPGQRWKCRISLQKLAKSLFFLNMETTATGIEWWKKRISKFFEALLRFTSFMQNTLYFFFIAHCYSLVELVLFTFFFFILTKGKIHTIKDF